MLSTAAAFAIRFSVLQIIAEKQLAVSSANEIADGAKLLAVPLHKFD